MSSKIERNTNLLVQAADDGDAAKVKRLIPVSNPLERDSAALAAAAYHGHVECVKLLLPVSDRSTREHQALRGAAARGHTECVKLLLEGAPKDILLSAFQTAVLWGHTECVEVLYNFCNPEQALRTFFLLAQDNPENDLYKLALEHLQQVMAEKQKQVLLGAVECGGGLKTRKL